MLWFYHILYITVLYVCIYIYVYIIYRYIQYNLCVCVKPNDAQ